MDSIIKSFGAVFGTNLSRQGIVQDLNRNTMLGLYNIVEDYQIHYLRDQEILVLENYIIQWGFVCPTESPDGGNVGIIDHISIMALGNFNVGESGIYEALIDHGLIGFKVLFLLIYMIRKYL